MVLSPENAQDLRWVLLTLGLKQTPLSKRAEVSQSWISNFLNGKSIRGKDLVFQVIRALEAELAEAVGTGVVEETDSHKIMEVLEAVREAFALPSTKRSSTPGLGVSPTHENYLSRRVQINGFPMSMGKAVNIVAKDCALPLTLAIVGPRKSGKSTIVQTLKKKLSGLGVVVLSVSVDQLGYEEDIEVETVLGRIDRWLRRVMARNWELQPEESDEEFFLWFSKSAALLKPAARMLVVEGISALPQEVTERLLRFLREFHRMRAVDVNLPSLCIVAQDSTFLNSFADPIIEVGSLQEEEVQRFAEQMGIGGDLVNGLYDLFAGQIYLTHMALEMLRAGMVSSVTQIQAMKEEGRRPFEKSRLELMGLD